MERQTKRSASTLRRTLALVVALGGCASPQGLQLERHPEVIRASELTDFQELTAFAAIRQLRPIWLNERGLGSMPFASQRPDAGDRSAFGPPGIRVYLDGIYSPEGLDRLRRFPAREVLMMQHLDPSDASFRYGLSHMLGAIMVWTRTG